MGQGVCKTYRIKYVKRPLSVWFIIIFQIKEHSLKNNIPDFHWFQLQSIKSLAAIHTPNSQEVVDGEEALNEAISVLVQSYNEVYNNQVPSKVMPTSAKFTRLKVISFQRIKCIKCFKYL